MRARLSRVMLNIGTDTLQTRGCRIDCCLQGNNRQTILHDPLAEDFEYRYYSTCVDYDLGLPVRLNLNY